ncbi:DUF2982 domain-containing protein [Thalassotalea sp. LPB0316]|uniref:DUF2982 domain-containing protein n=1 Tax=Thalassotalea sp. LPB0316 TaxID=2769490 RepID=UPI001868997F|nr:DUF2982 domain-containing protein [Thalassotalea sp. LPB0316]QOL24949.1 DUF2982 domain-containing protein [Thalassotalea sp. LPB0316]
MTTEIKIFPTSTRHSLFLSALGAVLLLICLLLINAYWQQAKLVLMFLTLASAVVLITGLSKHIEPKCSFNITPDGLTYLHRCGRWQLSWHAIKYIAPLRSTRGVEQQSLPYVGIVLTQLIDISTAITPRLANKLLHEQKPLLILAVQHDLLKVEDITLRFSPYKSAAGTITGPVGEFLHQCESLHKAFGFHLYIPSTALDRSVEDFSALLNQCKTASKNYG